MTVDSIAALTATASLTLLRVGARVLRAVRVIARSTCSRARQGCPR